jgi:predicted MFS family arabinose efflux permease
MNDRCSYSQAPCQNEEQRAAQTDRAAEAPSPQSRRGLDWLNFFMADVQTGFGSFVAFYLADKGWSEDKVGFVLTAGGLSGVVGQLPGGALVDAMRHKRLLIAVGTLMIAASAVLLALSRDFPAVFAAEVLHGATGAIIGPAIAAVSLGLVGRRAMSGRVGRNQRFNAAGNALTAASLGVIGTYVSKSAIFFAVAAMTVPTLAALAWIRPREIAYGRARNAAGRHEPGDLQRIFDLLKHRAILIFAAAAVLYRFADASMLPLVSENLGSGGEDLAALFMAAVIVVPQIIVALMAPWVADYAEQWGRKPMLLIGFGLEPLRGVLFALSTSWYSMIVVQLLDGVTGAIITVMTVLIMTDLTTGTGRFNLASGAVGTCTGIAAAVSTTATGVIAAWFGRPASFLTAAGVAALAVLLLWRYFPESRPKEYLD